MKKKYFSPEMTVNEIVSLRMFAASDPSSVSGGIGDEIIDSGYAGSKFADIWEFPEDE
jgi:hypothetical protein